MTILYMPGVSSWIQDGLWPAGPFCTLILLLYNQGFITAVFRRKKVVMRFPFCVSLIADFDLNFHSFRLRWSCFLHRCVLA
jgi:hypothetical protein